jgi:hypothetical protein
MWNLQHHRYTSLRRFGSTVGIKLAGYAKLDDSAAP